MSTISTYPHIVKPSGSPAHLESHPRTRIAMIVMDYLGRGLGPEDIVRHYPYLTLAEVHAAMTYYHDHQQEIDAEIHAELEELANSGGQESELAERLKQLACRAPAPRQFTVD